MNKSEIQARIEKVESELAKLKADLAKCDCTDCIEQEKCWFGVTSIGDCMSSIRRTKEECKSHAGPSYRPAYMPECRRVSASDVRNLFDGGGFRLYEETAKRAHKLGFRMKVTTP